MTRADVVNWIKDVKFDAHNRAVDTSTRRYHIAVGAIAGETASDSHDVWRKSGVGEQHPLNVPYAHLSRRRQMLDKSVRTAARSIAIAFRLDVTNELTVRSPVTK